MYIYIYVCNGIYIYNVVNILVHRYIYISTIRFIWFQIFHRIPKEMDVNRPKDSIPAHRLGVARSGPGSAERGNVARRGAQWNKKTTQNNGRLSIPMVKIMVDESVYMLLITFIYIYHMVHSIYG